MSRRFQVLSIILVLLTVAASGGALVLSHESPCGTAPAIAHGTATMKAAVYRCYGGPEVVKLEDVSLPVLTADRVLIRVRAASVNPLDWHYMRGKPFIVRLSAGVGTPSDIALGVDFAGTVERVGENVSRFKPGDDVFGGADGAFAEYVSVRDDGSLASKPRNMSFEQAASIPIAAVTALQALRDKGLIKAGQNVLINGASGGVGTFAVQLAKSFGARVTGVCSTRNLAMVRAIGADRVIDYTQQDFTGDAERYDLIIDTVGTHTLAQYRRVLTPHGALIMVGGPNDGPWIGALSGAIKAQIVQPFVEQRLVFMLADLNPSDLATLSGLMEAGQVTPVIDRRYPLSGVPEALAYLETGHARGKVVITFP